MAKKAAAKKRATKKKAVSPIVIEYKHCPNYEMNSISVNGSAISGGNDWDNHPSDQLEAIKATLTILGLGFEYHEESHDYDDDATDCDFCLEYGGSDEDDGLDDLDEEDSESSEEEEEDEEDW